MSMMDYNHEQARRNWQKIPDVMVGQQKQDKIGESLIRSAYDQERDELGNSLVFLEAVIDTLFKRLHPVISDVPSRPREEVLCRTSSPVVAALNDANQRVHRCAMNLQEIVERLEI